MGPNKMKRHSKIIRSMPAWAKTEERSLKNSGTTATIPAVIIKVEYHTADALNKINTHT